MRDTDGKLSTGRDIEEVNGEDRDNGRNGVDVERIKKGNRDKLRVSRCRKSIVGKINRE